MSYQRVVILNPWDSQGNQITDSIGIYPTIRACGGGAGISKDICFKGVQMSYQKITGPLMANSHPGSYCGQDAYSDMLVTDDGLLHRKWASASGHDKDSRSLELYARSTSNSEKWGGW